MGVSFSFVYLFSNNINTNFIAINIGDEGAQYLGVFLKNNDTLHVLDLYANDIGEEGARFLSEALKNNNCLRYLHLEGKLLFEFFNKIYKQLITISSKTIL